MIFRFRKSLPRAVILGASLATFASWGDGSANEDESVQALTPSVSCTQPLEKVVQMKTEVQDGLRFGVPERLVVVAQEGRVKIQPEQPTRTVDQITIWTTTPRPLPEGAVTTGDNPAPHTLVSIEGGMGGPEFAISIPKQVGDRKVTVRAYVQSEEGQPCFANAWAVWESLAAGN